ncbi:uncharacterized protein ATNIH1004_000270 [Aspergillus tanneri]|uniref:alpha-L-fucosidase n=1 Tax=Aspergillus tanneri TaxID=1220188 RepID=A0A5M9MWV7_9EURO|nr:uncharacterized protein ATNIH1004_000270 [Aspergillus tanneri]KAA8651388.1 hypothetical protein ATNIH1004_000270 [Aspergillus tanneri]
MHILYIVSLLLPLSQAVIFKPQNAFQPITPQVPSHPINLEPHFNNRAFGQEPKDANFDGSGNAYPAQQMPSSTFIYAGTNYTFPIYHASGNDNVLSQGQEIHLPRSKYVSVHILAASESGMASGTLNATYSDGSTSSTQVLIPAWWSWPHPAGGDLVFPHFQTPDAVDYNRSNIFQSVHWVDSSRELVSLTLPNVTGGAATKPGGKEIGTRLHIFAISVWPARTEAMELESPVLEVQYARSTRKWIMDRSRNAQIVEVVVTNVGSQLVLRNHTVRVRIDSSGVETVTEARINRLAPGDRATVEIGVRNKDGVEPGSDGPATVVISGHAVRSERYTFHATYGIAPYEATYESIYSHESPNWFNDAKYGIFIHWGPYAVPGWGNSGKNENYAEWYWWNLNQGPNTAVATYEHHLKTYGPDIVYDDFFQNFTADAWDPREWVDLFADAGAKYFVQVSKHHDGYAIFDLPAHVTERTSVVQPPHRNLLQRHISLIYIVRCITRSRSGFILTTGSMGLDHGQEVSPDPVPISFDYRKLTTKGNATNPFTNTSLPYTGYIPVSDYVSDKILPEMHTLAAMNTSIMWCDIGGPNRTTEFAAWWFNYASQQSHQVAMNARCGLPGDFDTPEYARYGSVQARKWESSLGMDPYSYGYNGATPLASYMNASEIVTSLVDIVSKNGNFLLDIGPMANGSILEVEQRNLRQAGKWIRSHAEAVFGTKYWFVTAEDGALRFVVSEDAFYIHCLGRPSREIVLRYPVPWVEGDEVTVVGGAMHGGVVPSRRMDNGNVVLEVSEEVAQGDQCILVDIRILEDGQHEMMVRWEILVKEMGVDALD